MGVRGLFRHFSVAAAVVTLLVVPTHGASPQSQGQGLGLQEAPGQDKKEMKVLHPMSRGVFAPRARPQSV